MFSWSLLVFFFKQKTAYEMRISDWSSDVCSSDLQFGKGKGKDAATVLGALAGAIGGHMAEQQIRATNTYDVTVSMETGSTRVINVPELGGLSTGEKVRIDGNTILPR